MSWQNDLQKALNKATLSGSSRYNDDGIRQLIHEHDLTFQDVFDEIGKNTKRIEGIEETQRKIIKILESGQGNGTSTPKVSDNVVEPNFPSSSNGSTALTLSKKYRYEATMESPRATWKKRPNIKATTGELVAIIEGLHPFNPDTGWLFMLHTEHENLWTLVVNGNSLRTDAQRGVDIEGKFKHSMGSTIKTKFGVYKYMFRWVWNSNRISLTITNTVNGSTVSFSEPSVRLNSPVKHLAVGRQSMNYGRRGDVGDGVMVHKAICGLS